MLQKVSGHIWCLEADHHSDRPALGYILGEKRSFAVDAGASKAHVELFYQELEARGLPLPAFTGISHYHWDHSYGAAFLHGVSLASQLCAEELERESTWRWTPEDMRVRLQSGEDVPFGYYSKLAEYPDVSAIRVAVPEIALEGEAVFDLGGIHVQAICCGGPHSDDQMIFFIPEEGFLFLGDASGKELFQLSWDYDPAHPERLNDTLAALPFNQSKLRPFVQRLEVMPFTHCLFAHADRVWSREELLTDLRAHLTE